MTNVGGGAVRCMPISSMGSAELFRRLSRLPSPAAGGVALRRKALENEAGMTTRVIEKFALSANTLPFISRVARLCSGSRADTPETRRAFWNVVSFYNYVQELPGAGPRPRPTDSMWAGGAAPFAQVLRPEGPRTATGLVPLDDAQCRGSQSPPPRRAGGRAQGRQARPASGVSTTCGSVIRIGASRATCTVAWRVLTMNEGVRMDQVVLSQL